MLNSNIQIIYQADEIDSSKIHWSWEEEALAMENVGFFIGTIPDHKVTRLIYRGGRNLSKIFYAKYCNFINNYNHVIDYSMMSKYYKYIADISIETFFVDELNEFVINEIHSRGWHKAFIKNDIKSLEFIDVNKSIWPKTTLDEMNILYNQNQLKGIYAIRKFIEKERLDDEERYWVLNGKIYHRENKVPKVVKVAADRLNKLGSKYYTIDATPEFIVEVNAGESSDRHAVNSAELFANWFKTEFLSN